MKARLSIWEWAGFAGLAALAIWLRVDGLFAQTPFHDEWHALVASATETPWQSFTRFGHADRSIPVVMGLHLLKATVGITAATLWGPFAIAGIVGVFAVPALMWKALGPKGAVALGALLAANPLLVLYSRFARPYGICALSVVVVAVLLADFAEAPSGRRAVAIVGLSAGAAWALPVFAPFLGGAMLAEIGRSVRGPRRRLIALMLLAVAVAGALLLLLGPALLADGQSLRSKSLSGQPTLSSLWAGVVMLSGAGWLGWLPLLGLLAVIGGRELHRTAPARALNLAAGSAAQLVAVLAVRPAEVERPFVFARYELAVGVVLAIAVAAGIGRLAGSSLSTFVAVALFAGFVASAPLAMDADGTDNFGSMRAYHRLFFSRAELDRWFHDLPAPYVAAFARESGGPSAIVEAPYNGLLRVPYPYYQSLHGREVFLGEVETLCIDEGNRELPPSRDTGVRLDRFVDLSDSRALAALGARFVFFHEDVESEVPWVRNETRRRNRFDFERCVEAFRKVSGVEPRIAQGLAVFDLRDE